MWTLSNRTPYAAKQAWVQDRDANKIWLIVVKATFDVLADGSTRLADDQMPVLPMARYAGPPEASSLLYEADLAGVKVTTDVVANARAWAPSKLATAVDVQMRVGPISKQLRVIGDRVWTRTATGTTPSKPAPFESLPITYERAYGGWDRSAPDAAEHRLDTRNPAGTGFATRMEHCLDMRLPNVEHPNRLIQRWSDRPEPAGLAPLGCHWSPRRELAGTYDDAWFEHQFPLWADDFDGRYHNAAPRDQQTMGFLRGGELVQLTNLSRDGSFSFTLPRVYPFFRTDIGRKRSEHRAQMATVVIEPELRRVIMSWQTSLVCNHDVDMLDRTIITEKTAV